MGNQEFTDRLAQAGKWNDVPDEPEQMPIGTYIFQLQDATVVEINDLLKVRWEHYTLGGEEAGRTQSDLSALEPNPTGTKQGNDFMMSLGKGRLRRMCELAGVDFPDDMRDTEEAVEQIAAAAPCYRAEVKHTKSKKDDRTYVNITVKDAVDPSEVGGETKSERKAKEEDAPADEADEGSAVEAPDVGATITFDDGEGGKVTAVVKKVDGKKVFADDQNPKVKPEDQEWTLTLGNPDDVFDVVDAAGDGDGDGDDDENDLIDLGEALDLQFDEDDDNTAMAKKIGDEKGPLDPKTLTDEEKALCKKYGIPVKAAAKKKVKKKKKRKK